MLTRYKGWANDLTFTAVCGLPAAEVIKPRQTRFGNMVHTLNHVYVIDAIFKAHLLGKPHGYTARNTPTHPPLAVLWRQQKQIDRWYIDYANLSSNEMLAETINFQFIDGSDGWMSRAEMILHVVNHSTYHRGFVGDLMYQVPATPPANDLPVYLRSHPTNAYTTESPL
ncbi:MAG: putative damage-inducible protein DinB [Motiliproteus sp.]|jgi:uncharacterized damage-inducible protein DinB